MPLGRGGGPEADAFAWRAFSLIPEVSGTAQPGAALGTPPLK